ncbi:chaplin family protein [Streptomyces inhibens]|uniref:chaplin family protein n=1 Tax=Streptomyces inhibens TaxID=2293571 RepID=UPI00402A92C3
MRQSLKTCVFVAASGVLGASGSAAYADAGAGGSATNSPGVLSGNSIQVTVDTPVNACGNSVDAGAALNPAMGASCGNGAPPEQAVQQPPPTHWPPPAQRPPEAMRAPGVHWTPTGPAKRAEPVQRQAAPRTVQRPDQEPVRRPAGSPAKHARKPAPHPVQDPRVDAVARAGASAGSALLASTGAEQLGMVAGMGGGLVLGGALLLRRARTRRR